MKVVKLTREEWIKKQTTVEKMNEHAYDLIGLQWIPDQRNVKSGSSSASQENPST